IVEHHQHLLAAVLGVALVDVATLHGPGVAGLTAVDVGNAVGVAGHHPHHRVILVAGGHIHGGHHTDPVGVEAAGHMGLGALHIQTLVGAPGDVHKQVWIRLLGGALAAIALGV